MIGSKTGVEAGTILEEPSEKKEAAAQEETALGQNGDSTGSSSITSQAYSRLRSDIMSGVLTPGKKLKIEELRSLYDFGSSPIREALSMLTSDLFVERIDQRGFRVADVSEQEFDELLLTRRWLEERALRESIAHGDSRWEEQVVLSAYRLSRVPRSQSGDQFVANEEWEIRHKHFHMALIAACPSSIMLKFCDQLYDQNVRYRHLSGSKAYPSRDINAEHNSITDAVLERNADLAVELLMSHYSTTGNFLKEKLAPKKKA
ncbi:MAG: FCD domain-containing protein [Hoeflea sp.]|uniref:FCD domain-containing protein n=1 Tax=Hoeflea sp. TaxID=1940281 RepID=UPI003EF0CF71